MSVLVTGDGEIVDPDRPMLFADDLAALRGDGVGNIDMGFIKNNKLYFL